MLYNLSKYRNGLNYRKLDQIIEPLEKFDNYYGVYDEDEAKWTLIEFFQKLQKIKPSKDFFVGERGEYYLSFVNILLMRDALSKGKYAWGCHELLTLIFYEPILQKRIYNSLMLLYQQYLGG